MSAKNPLNLFQGHFSVRQGRKRKRNEPQNPTLSVNSAPALNNPNPKFYPMVESILSLAVFSSADDYELLLVDKDNNYIEGTLFVTNREEVVQKIIILIRSQNFSKLIRYLQQNLNSQAVNKAIWHIQTAAKNLLFASMSIPISGRFFIVPPIYTPTSTVVQMLPSFSVVWEEALQGEEERLKLERLNSALNNAHVVYSGRSGSPVYGDLRLSVSAIKQDQPEDGAALNPFTK